MQSQRLSAGAPAGCLGRCNVFSGKSLVSPRQLIGARPSRRQGVQVQAVSCKLLGQPEAAQRITSQNRLLLDSAYGAGSINFDCSASSPT